MDHDVVTWMGVHLGDTTTLQFYMTAHKVLNTWLILG
jgi:hypothetical protein